VIAPQSQVYTTDESSHLLPTARDLLSIHRKRVMGAGELAVRLHQRDEYAAQAVIEALTFDGEVLT